MTDKELYTMLIKQLWEQVDKTNVEEIRQYNAWKRDLRKVMFDE